MLPGLQPSYSRGAQSPSLVPGSMLPSSQGLPETVTGQVNKGEVLPASGAFMISCMGSRIRLILGKLPNLSEPPFPHPYLRVPITSPQNTEGCNSQKLLLLGRLRNLVWWGRGRREESQETTHGAPCAQCSKSIATVGVGGPATYSN